MKCRIHLLALTILSTLATQSTAQLAGSLSFNGNDNYVEIAESPLNLIQTGDFTFEALIQGPGTNQSDHPVLFSNRGESAFGGGIMVFLHDIWGGSTAKMLCFQVNATNYLFVNNGAFDGDILDGQCHHIAISRMGSTPSNE